MNNTIRLTFDQETLGGLRDALSRFLAIIPEADPRGLPAESALREIEAKLGALQSGGSWHGLESVEIELSPTELQVLNEATNAATSDPSRVGAAVLDLAAGSVGASVSPTKKNVRRLVVGFAVAIFVLTIAVAWIAAG